MIYFAYGSNMSCLRMLSRVYSAKSMGIGYLQSHILAFHKPGRIDGTGKCNAFKTGNPDDSVIGILYKINPVEKCILDRHEGVGQGYEVKQVSVMTSDGEVIKAFTYYATVIKKKLKPLNWYMHHVMHGARENNLPAPYLKQLMTVKSIEDNDTIRLQKELSIYE